MSDNILDSLNRIENNLQQIIQEYDFLLTQNVSVENMKKQKEKFESKRGDIKVMIAEYKQMKCTHEFVNDVFDVCPEFSVAVTYCKLCDYILQQ